MNSLQEYFKLMEERPHLFTDSPVYPIIKDKNRLEQYIQETKTPLGVVYKSDYNLLLVDLIENEDGSCFTYERIVPASNKKGTVIVPLYQGKYILLKQYRHPLRKTQICFPRGYGSPNLESEQNAKQELLEEIGASVKAIKCLGTLCADSGLIANYVDIYLCEIESFDKTIHTEGIQEIFLCTHEELKSMIQNNEIDDGFTLCAFSFLNR